VHKDVDSIVEDRGASVEAVVDELRKLASCLLVRGADHERVTEVLDIASVTQLGDASAKHLQFAITHGVSTVTTGTPLVNVNHTPFGTS